MLKNNENMKLKVGMCSETDFTGMRLGSFHCICMFQTNCDITYIMKWYFVIFWQSLLTALKWEKPEVSKLISFLTTFEQEYVFMNRSVKEILWGYQDPTLHLAKGFAPEWFYTDIAGYFINVSRSKWMQIMLEAICVVPFFKTWSKT